MTKDMLLLKEKTRQFKTDLKKYFPHKDIAEYTRLMDELENFEQYGLSAMDDDD